MDITDIRAILTVVMLLLFVGICVWAYSKQTKQRFEQAAQLPFLDAEEQLHRASVEEADRHE